MKKINVNKVGRNNYLSEIQKGIDLDLWKDMPHSSVMDVPIIPAYEGGIPEKLVAFHNRSSIKGGKCAIHFYINDYLFLPFVKNPRKYLEVLGRAYCVIGPDRSQYADMPWYKRFTNSCSNKEISAFLAANGIPVVPNVSWSLPDSYNYCFEGFPRKSIIAINSSGIKNNQLSTYLWYRGYEEVLRRLEPTAIIRYGEKMDGEEESISHYFINERLNIMRHGR